MNAERAIDRAVLALMTCLPLLPAGPAYLDLDPGVALDVGLGVLVLLACWSRLHRARRTPSPPRAADRRLDPILAAWLLFAAAATGATVVGLVANNDVTSPVFRYQLADVWRVLWPVDRVWDPLQPLYMWVVFIEGLVAYASLRVICTSAPDPVRRARAAIRGWWYGFGLVGVFAIVQYLTRFRLDPFWVAANPDLTRSHSTLDDPNALGSYLLLGLFLTAAYVALADGARRRTVALLFAAVGGAALLASGSRVAIVAAVLAALVALAVRRPRDASAATSRSWPQWAARWLLVGGLVVVVTSLAARWLVDPDPAGYRPDSVAGALASSLDPRVPLSEVLKGRQVWWASALEMWRDHPVVGVGLGRYPRLLASGPGPSGLSLDAHDLFLQVLAETGLPGLTAFALLLGVIFVSLARLRRTAGDAGPLLASAVLFGSVAYVATFTTGHPLLLPSGQILWATLLAAVVVAAGSGRGERTGASPGGLPPDARSWARPGSWRRPAAVAAICAVIVAAYAVGATTTATGSIDGPWGYSHGLYPLETGPTPFRWTGGRALIHIRVPQGATSLVLQMAVSPALRDGRPTAIRVFRQDLGGATASRRRDVFYRRVTRPTVLTATVPLEDAIAEQGGVLVGIVVHPTFVPARLTGGADERELGVRLLAPRFVDARATSLLQEATGLSADAPHE